MSIPINEKDNQYQESESIAMNLESLKAEASKLLIQYKQAVLNYVNYLREESLSPSTSRSVSSVNGQSYWGSFGISQMENSSLQECEAACFNNRSCTGATFNSKKQTCWIRGGKSSVVPSSSEDIAVLPKATQLASTIKGINEQLTSVIEKILGIINGGNSNEIYATQTQNRELNSQTLLQDYNNLVAEREKIEHILYEYQNLDKTQKDSHLIVNQNYYTFLLLLGLVILVCFLLMKFTFGSKIEIGFPSLNFDGELGKNVYYIVFGIILLTIGIHFYNKRF